MWNQFKIYQVADDLIDEVKQGPIGLLLIHELELRALFEGKEPILLIHEFRI